MRAEKKCERIEKRRDEKEREEEKVTQEIKKKRLEMSIGAMMREMRAEREEIELLIAKRVGGRSGKDGGRRR